MSPTGQERSLDEYWLQSAGIFGLHVGAEVFIFMMIQRMITDISLMF